MCQQKSIESQVISIPVLNHSTREVVSNVFHSVFITGATDIVADGIETLPSAVDGENVYNVVLKLATDTDRPKVIADTPVVHTFEMTATQMTSAGFDQNTKIKFTINLDGTPVPDIFWIYYNCQSMWVWGKLVTTCRSRRWVPEENNGSLF